MLDSSKDTKLVSDNWYFRRYLWGTTHPNTLISHLIQALAANFITGLISVFLGCFGRLILKVVPPAALLVPIAGIGIAFLGLEQLTYSIAAPIVGFNAIMWMYLGWYAGIKVGYLNYRIPEALMVILVGVILGKFDFRSTYCVFLVQCLPLVIFRLGYRIEYSRSYQRSFCPSQVVGPNLDGKRLVQWFWFGEGLSRHCNSYWNLSCCHNFNVSSLCKGSGRSFPGSRIDDRRWYWNLHCIIFWKSFWNCDLHRASGSQAQRGEGKYDFKGEVYPAFFFIRSAKFNTLITIVLSLKVGYSLANGCIYFFMSWFGILALIQSLVSQVR